MFLLCFSTKGQQGQGSEIPHNTEQLDIEMTRNEVYGVPHAEGLKSGDTIAMEANVGYGVTGENKPQDDYEYIPQDNYEYIV